MLCTSANIGAGFNLETPLELGPCTGCARCPTSRRFPTGNRDLSGGRRYLTVKTGSGDYGGAYFVLMLSALPRELKSHEKR